MKKISLVLALAGTILAVQAAHSQSGDTTRNKIEVKKKVKVGVHGRQVTKVKMEGKGTPGAITGSVDGAVNDKPNVRVVTPAPQPNPAVVVVHDRVQTPATTTVTTTTQANRVPVTSTHVTKTATSTAHVTHTTTASRPVYHRRTVTSRPVAASRTTTTTTTIKKE